MGAASRKADPMISLAIGVVIGAVLAVAVPAVASWASKVYNKGKEAVDKVDLL
jgi:competence protein ComGC